MTTAVASVLSLRGPAATALDEIRARAIAHTIIDAASRTYIVERHRFTETVGGSPLLIVVWRGGTRMTVEFLGNGWFDVTVTARSTVIYAGPSWVDAIEVACR